MLGGMLVLGFLVESMTEYLFDFAGEWKKYIAAALGVFVALSFQVNAIEVYFGDMVAGSALAWWVGTVFTGLVLGRGANYIHDVFKQFEIDKKGV